MGSNRGQQRVAGEFLRHHARATGGEPVRAVADGMAWLARACLLAVLISAPWAFGGVKLGHQWWLYAGVLISLGLWLVSFLLQPRELRIIEVILPTLLVPLAGALLLGAVQITPGLPQNLPIIDHISTVDTSRDPAHGELGHLAPPLVQDLAKRTQFSIFPASTRLELMRLTAGIAAFLAGLGLFAVPRAQRWLLGALAVNGACLAFFGIIQKLSWNEKIYWTIPLTQGGQPFAAFVNRNNAAGYLNLCLAAAAGFLAWTFWRPSSHISYDASGEPETVRSHRFLLQTPQLFAGLLCIVTMAGVCASVSRGGVLSAALAGLAVLLLLAVRRGARVAAWAAGVGSIFCACLLGWLGLADSLAQRFEEKISSSTRWENWKDAWRAVGDFPILGTGFGTYRYAYQPYQIKPVKLWFYNADNHYVEGLTEGGAVGLTLIVVCVLLMVRTTWFLMRRNASGGTEALAYVALFALVSQMVHAGFDFGISVPANLLTFAVLCGVLVGEAARRSVPHRPPLSIALPVWQPSLVLVVVTVVLIANGCLGIEEVAKAEVSRLARHGMPPLTAPKAMNATKLEARIRHLNDAIRLRPDDAEAQHALGELWIYRYRIQFYEEWQQRFEADSRTVPPANWNATGLAVLHRRANAAFRDAQLSIIDEMRQHPLVAENLRPALQHLLAAQAACPLITKTDLDVATLTFLEEADPCGIRHLERAVALAPVDEDQLFIAGLLAEQAARSDLSELYWQKSLVLGTRHQRKIFDYSLENHSLNDVVDRLIPDQPAKILELAQTRFSGETQAAERQLLIAKATALLEAAASHYSEADRLYWSGVAEHLNGNPDRAISLLKQAVSRKSDMIDWRLELVKAYRTAGRLDDALEEVRFCLGINPEQAAVEELRRELVHEKLTAPTSKRRLPNADPSDREADLGADSASESNSAGTSH
jgi:O-antigen ligase